ncbi:MAG: SUMF1/EgtB/PvdO family nonheme iron enzyme [Verrucomicrobia bacterium]|nr:MAG: SUMF1/EgtB/PvdO family nonheme iron enzyme [Verrucomicrobiota bacterium]
MSAGGAGRPYKNQSMKLRTLFFSMAAACGMALQAQFVETNWALSGAASQSSDLNDTYTAEKAIDGNTDGANGAASITHSGGTALDNGDPFWEVDLQTPRSIGRVQVWFRTDCCQNRNDDFTLIVMSASRQVLWTQTYVGRPPANVAFNIAPAVTGQIVRFEPQKPLTTSDGFFSLAEVQVVAPYSGASILVTQSPADVSVTEGRYATFGPVAATAVGAPQDKLTIQWQKNGVDIPGAMGATYTTATLQKTSDQNTEYGVRFLLSGVAVPSTKAKLGVTKDLTAPLIDSLAMGGGATLEATLRFNEVMDAASAQTAGNYNFGAGVTVSKAVLGGVLLDSVDGHPYQNVVLSIVGLAQNVPYALTVSGVNDLAGNTILPTHFNGTTPFFEVNLARTGTATQSSTGPGGDASHAIDGNTNGFFSNGSVTINEFSEDPGWWEVDLGATKAIGRLNIWFRTLTTDECQALFNSCSVRNDDFTMKVLDASRNVVWQRTYSGRPPTQVPYNQAVPLNGRYVRFESQTPLTTSDGFFSLAEVEVIAPYANASVVVTQNPADKSVFENQVAVLGPVAATVDGAPAANLQYQWQKNGSDIQGATSATYQTPVLSLTDSGSTYRCKVVLSGISATSTAATVIVNKDVTAPTIQSVVGDPTYTYVTVVFSEGVKAGDIAYYAFDGGLTVSEISVLTPNSVRLTTSPQTAGKLYTVTINNVRDLAAGGGNPIAANSTRSFTAVTSLQDRFVRIGNPGNPKDATGFGAVAKPFWMSKYILTTTEFAAFLNSVATSVTSPHALWHPNMEIDRTGTDTYSYAVRAGREKAPVAYLSTIAAMRYANWLHNGGTAASDTETGVYTFSGEEVFGARDPNALYFLPTPDEWYKAAYYDPTKGGTGYWLYAVRTDEADPAKPNGLIAELPPGGAHSANFNNVAITAENPFGVTDVGAYTAASSYYGTFDQTGNQWEWAEPAVGATRARRMGGSQGNNAARLAATTVADNGINAGGTSVNQSARLAKADRLVLELVTVADPNNPNDVATGAGKVANVYRIAKYLTRNSDFAAFLNAVATSPTYTHGVWDSRMQITRDGTDAYSYTVLPGFENRPVNFASTVSAMRFCNWLHNGGTVGSDTETGAYTFTSETVFTARDPNAKFFLPTPNEWYKAAYYDPTKGGSDYWLYAVRTDEADPAKPNGLISELPPGGAHSANFNNVAVSGGNAAGTTDVGAYTAASSYYGTFDQTGELWEWAEPLVGATRARRMGGSQGNNAARLAATTVADNGIDPGGTSVNQGFRVAARAIGAVVVSKLTAMTSGGGIKISWTSTGVLESAPAVNGPWTPVPGAANGQVLQNTGTKFYRLSQ